jgi:predicted Zn finger-like uncharacterized protein
MLTTRCPHCQTLFKIRPEQLSQRGGRVRCGHCQQAFSALSNLEDADQQGSETPPAPRPIVTPSAPSPLPTSKPGSTLPPRTVAQPPLAQQRPEIVSRPTTTPSPPPPEPPSPRPVVPPSFNRVNAAPVPLNTPVPPPSVNSWDDFALPVDIEELDETHNDAWATVSHFSPESDREIHGFSAQNEVPPPVTPPPTTIPAMPPMTATGAPPIALPPSTPVPPAERREPTLAQAQPTPTQSVPDLDLDLDLGKAHEEAQTIPLDASPFNDVSPAEMDNNGPVSLFDERERQNARESAEENESLRFHPHKSGGASLLQWSLSLFIVAGIFVLLGSYMFRTELARTIPALRPTLEKACFKVGCKVPYPKDADQIYLESHSLNPEPGRDGQYRLVVTLMNKANYSQTWPHLELTVTDRFDIAVARRTLAPTEWLPPEYTSHPALAGREEVTANLPLDLTKVQAAGYRLYVFYP